MTWRLRALRTGEDRRGSCASQTNGCCFDPAMEEQLFTLGEQLMQGSRSTLIKRSSTKDSKFQPLQCIWQEEEKRLKRSKCKKQPSGG